MNLPPIRKFSHAQPSRHAERGMTMVLVALAMVAIIAMAALSIDIVTLYLAREEAQRSADAAALAAERVISLSGATGDPGNTTGDWPTACTAATQVAKAVANQNAVGNATATSVNVNFLYNGTAVPNCAFAGSNAFGVNPQVQVQVIRTGLPTFFSRIWSRNTNSVSATATAEAFNSSGSGAFAPNGIVPVNPRCVKPWIIPNKDPGNGGNTFVNPGDGSITNPGIQVNGAGTGVIGERLTLTSACGGGRGRRGGGCNLQSNPPLAGSYIPAAVVAPVSAYPSCANNDTFEEAIGGCDQNTQYACGVSGGASADLTINPARDTRTAAQCLINNAGPDSLDTSIFPYQIQAGTANPVITSGVVTSSTSIATVPIYDSRLPLQSTNNPTITIVGFLQVFINQADFSLNVTVLNVAGCSNTATNPPIPASGTSPVPIRLITSP